MHSAHSGSLQAPRHGIESIQIYASVHPGHYVESTGGKLELVAQFPNRPPMVIEHLGVASSDERKARSTA